MQCKSLWIKTSAKCINVNVNVIITVMNLVATHYNCTSPMDYISHHALHPHIPLHQSHSCHHSLINPDCFTTPAPHSHTHISSSLPCTHREVLFCPGWHSERFPCFLIPCVYLDCLFTLTVCCLPFWPCLPVDIFSVCCLLPALTFALSLILPSLHYSCYCLWPLPVWPLVWNKAAIWSNLTASALQ